MKDSLGHANALPVSLESVSIDQILHRLQVAFYDDIAQAIVDIVFRSKTGAVSQRTRGIRQQSSRDT